MRSSASPLPSVVDAIAGNGFAALAFDVGAACFGAGGVGLDDEIAGGATAGDLTAGTVTLGWQAQIQGSAAMIERVLRDNI